MFQCTLQKSRLVFLVGLLTASAGAVSVFGQEEGKARVSQDSQKSISSSVVDQSSFWSVSVN